MMNEKKNLIIDDFVINERQFVDNSNRKVVIEETEWVYKNSQ
jgi:hypothetical protein